LRICGGSKLCIRRRWRQRFSKVTWFLNVLYKVTIELTFENLWLQRPPRSMSRDGLLRVYDLEAARGRDVLLRYEGGKYRDELFVCYLELPVCVYVCVWVWM